MKWYENIRREKTRARVQYERAIAQGIVAGLIFLVGLIVGRLL